MFTMDILAEVAVAYNVLVHLLVHMAVGILQTRLVGGIKLWEIQNAGMANNVIVKIQRIWPSIPIHHE